jgi:hypothetical protein
MSAARVPDWKLERLAAGELPPEEAAGLRERLEPGRLEEIARSNEAILEAHPPRRVAAAIRERASRGQRSRAFAWAGALAATSAAVILVAQLGHRSDAPDWRPKGAPHLVVYRHSPAGDEELQADAPARAGDLIQLRYVSAGHRYGAVLSVDGRGAVTLHFPEDAHQSSALPGAESPLPHAYQLDDAPAFERFFFITADREIPLDRLLSAAHSLAASPEKAARGRLPVDADMSESSLLLRKVSP